MAVSPFAVYLIFEAATFPIGHRLGDDSTFPIILDVSQSVKFIIKTITVFVLYGYIVIGIACFLVFAVGVGQDMTKQLKEGVYVSLYNIHNSIITVVYINKLIIPIKTI